MWLAVVPIALVRACLATLPRLEAEETIARVNVIRMATGRMDAETARPLGEAWEAAARRDGPTEPAPVQRPVPPRRDLSPEVLTDHGFQVRLIPRRRPAAAVVNEAAASGN